MKIMKANKLIVVLLSSMAGIAQAQPATDSVKDKSMWDKKFYWGLTVNNSLTTIKGTDLPNKYFWKPSVGASIRSEYYVHRHVAIAIGIQYQQKGSGIITEDKVKTLGDPDSTYRARIKLHALEIPIAIVFRSNEVIKNTRFHGSIGISPMKNFKSSFVQYSIEDGFHVIENHKGRYYKSDLGIAASLGVDINAGNSAIFQVHLYATWGTKNVYNQDFYPDAQGKTKVIGLRLGWMF
jgi:Outer membrane protein beta-barrel domain